MTEKAVPFFFDLTKEVVIEISHNMTFGRNKDCDYSVVDHRVSGVHFKAIIKDGDVYIVDLESSNKTKVNDDVLSPNTEKKVSIKDNIKFGNQRFYFFNEPIEKFEIPDITRTLTISHTADVVDEMIDSSHNYNEMNLSISKNKKGSLLNELKKSKALVDSHELSLKSVLEKIDKRDSIIKEYDSLMMKIQNSKQELNNANFVDKSKLDEDCKKNKFTIDELNNSINDAQMKIDTWKKDIRLLQEKIEEAKRVELIHKCLESDQEIEASLSKEVEAFRAMNLDDTRDELQRVVKKEFDNYKYLQEGYSDSLKYKRNRLAS